jgi:uncharacterized membrane protein
MPALTMVAAASPWLEVFGRLHPLVLHLPLGLLTALAVLEFGAMVLRRPVPRGPVLALACVCGVTALLAALSGLVLAGEPGYEGETVGDHKIAGIVLGVLCVLIAPLAMLSRRMPFRIVLALALAAAFPAGHLGGELTHGEGFVFAPLANAPAANATEFEHTIAPILKRSCTKCHNPDKLKGELDLTTRAGIEKGGENGDTLVAGKPDDSALLTRCLLPETDDDVMPPEGKKPRPTKEELTTLRAWIEAGAKFE